MTDTVTVHGGRPLRRPLRLAGFKHALVPVLAAGVLAERPVVIRNAPDIEDTRTLLGILRRLGASATLETSTRTLTLDTSGLCSWQIPDELSARIHGAVYLMPVLLGRFGRFAIGMSGGCRIGDRRLGGERPIDHMLDVLCRFGATIRHLPGSVITGSCRRLAGTTIDLADYAVPAPHDGRPTGPLYSGASKTALLAAAAATGTSVLLNPYPKPDVTELTAALAEAGVALSVEPGRIVVQGSGQLPRGFDHVLVSDLIEAVTLIACAVHLRQPLMLDGVTAAGLRSGLRPELEHLARMGVELDWGASSLVVRPPEAVTPVDLVAASHSIYSDSQPFFALMLMGATGRSTITEAVWKDRSHYVHDLVRLGGRLQVDGPVITVEPGRVHLAGQRVVAGDVRSAAVGVVAALGIDGPTVVEGVRHLDRGYEGLVRTLCAAGAHIETGELAPVAVGGPDPYAQRPDQSRG
jgi:UDP-N-acetylglucosamine 1-carboxyvinyltransferase